MMRHRTGQQRFACPWRPEQQHAFGLGHAQGLKQFRMLDGKLYYLQCRMPSS